MKQVESSTKRIEDSEKELFNQEVTMRSAINEKAEERVEASNKDLIKEQVKDVQAGPDIYIERERDKLSCQEYHDCKLT